MAGQKVIDSQHQDRITRTNPSRQQATRIRLACEVRALHVPRETPSLPRTSDSSFPLKDLSVYIIYPIIPLLSSLSISHLTFFPVIYPSTFNTHFLYNKKQHYFQKKVESSLPLRYLKNMKIHSLKLLQRFIIYLHQHYATNTLADLHDAILNLTHKSLRTQKRRSQLNTYLSQILVRFYLGLLLLQIWPITCLPNATRHVSIRTGSRILSSAAQNSRCVLFGNTTTKGLNAKIQLLFARGLTLYIIQQPNTALQRMICITLTRLAF